MKVAVLGTGLLGRPIAERLAACGHEVVAYNRTRAKAEPLRAVGIAVVGRPEEALAQAACAILMLADARAIRHTLLSETAKGALKGRTLIQMGTIGPQESRALQDEVRACGGDYFECPVLGSLAEATSGRLLLMVGGDPRQLERWGEVLRCLGPEPRHIGDVGRAAALKLALNQLIAAETAAFALSLGLVRREGVPTEVFMDLLRSSALYARTFDKKLPRLLARNFQDPNFSTRHLLKDVRLCLEEAERVDLDPHGLAGVVPLLEKAIALGFEEADYSAVYNAIDPEPT
ncbi:NAD(P)-dependent oxidoreductase [Candidatus Nitrospira bockiana]